MSSRAYDASNFTTVPKPDLVEVRKGWLNTTVYSIPTDQALASVGATFDLSNSTFHGPVFNNAVFHDAVTITQGLTAPAPGKAALEQALEALRTALAALPEAQRAEANEAAEAAKKLAEAAKPEASEGFFRRAATTLRDVAGEIGKTAPAVVQAGQAVVDAVAAIRGWTS